MKRIIQRFGLLFVLMATVSACVRVDPTKEVGILVKTTGTKVLSPDELALRRGRVLYNPFTHDLHLYPITYQTVTWTAENNEALAFTTADKAQVAVDFSLTYAVVPEKVPHNYVKHRKPLDILTQTYMKSKVRASLNSVGERYRAEEIVGGRRTEFLREVKDLLNEDLADEGFVFDMVEIVNSPRLPDNVQNAINLALEATQNAQIAENQLREITAQAAKALEQAKGDSAAAVTRARGAAEEALISARAEAEANRIKKSELTDLLLRQQAIEKWDGSYPTTVLGNNVPMIQVR